MSEPVYLDQTLRLAPGVRFQSVNDEVVLFDVDRGTYFGLNEVGARVWVLLGEGLQGDALVERLTDEYEVAQDRLSVDVNRLLGELHQQGLIEVIDESD